MNRLERLNSFVVNEVEHILYDMEKDISQKEKEYTEFYKSQLLSLFESICSLQKNYRISDIGIISVVLSWVNLDNNLFFYNINLYPQHLYYDTYTMDFSLDVSNIYHFFEYARNCLYNTLQQSTDKFQICEINSSLNQYIQYFNIYIVKILKKVLKEKEVLDRIHQMKTTNDFCVVQNELYELPYLLYEKHL